MKEQKRTINNYYFNTNKNKNNNQEKSKKHSNDINKNNEDNYFDNFLNSKEPIFWSVDEKYPYEENINIEEEDNDIDTNLKEFTLSKNTKIFLNISVILILMLMFFLTIYNLFQFSKLNKSIIANNTNIVNKKIEFEYYNTILEKTISQDLKDAFIENDYIFIDTENIEIYKNLTNKNEYIIYPKETNFFDAICNFIYTLNK